jgi:predicted nucleic acid-binding protein
MLASVTINRVRVEEAWERSAEDLLDQYQDHELSYTDATSFVTMRALRIPQAMSFDLDFELAGFQTLT